MTLIIGTLILMNFHKNYLYSKNLIKRKNVLYDWLILFYPTSFEIGGMEKSP